MLSLMICTTFCGIAGMGVTETHLFRALRAACSSYFDMSELKELFDRYGLCRPAIQKLWYKYFRYHPSLALSSVTGCNLASRIKSMQCTISGI